MDLPTLKKSRGVIRRIFTKTKNDLEGLIVKKEELDNIKILALIEVLNGHYQNILKQDSLIFDLLMTNENVSENELDDELNGQNEYSIAYEVMKKTVDKLLLDDKQSAVSEGGLSQRSLDQVGLVSNCSYKLPQLKFREFGGELKDWLPFWSQFSKIDSDNSISPNDKIQYLVMATTPNSVAREVVESYPATGDMYPEVVRALKSRFGREDLLTEYYIRELLKIVVYHASSTKKLSVTELHDKLQCHLRNLETLGVSSDTCAPILLPLVSSCLPEDILKLWERSSKILSRTTDENNTSKVLLENLLSFLKCEIEGEQKVKLAMAGFGHPLTVGKDRGKSNNISVPSVSKSSETSTASGLHSTVKNEKTVNQKCLFCSLSHKSQDCIKAQSIPFLERKTAVASKRACFCCLKTGHIAKNCKTRPQCIICKKPHYVIMCDEVSQIQKHSTQSTLTEVGEAVHKPTEVLLTNMPSEHEIYLKTIIVKLQHENKELCVRALIDDGSHRSYIEKSLAAELNLSPSGKEVLSQGLFGGGVTPAAEHCRYTVTVKSLDSKFSTTVSLLDQTKICSTLPRIRDKNLLTELATRGITLTDIGRETPPIRVLLGADVLGSILTGRIEVLPSGVSAIETLLGWTVLGLGKKKQVVNMVTVTMLQNIEVPKLWDLDVLGITDPVQKKNKTLLEEETLSHFRETINVCEDQRYEVALPWLAGHPTLYDKSDVAESRLRTTTKRLLSENNFESYDAVFKQWESEDIIEVVPKEQISKPSHYLPHRAVIKMSSSTTKVRPVFDASFKRSGYASLNECLSVGPSLIHQILPLLLRFRLGAVGVIADIKQAFLQIRLRVEDRDVLRFLWWEDASRTKLKIYRHCRVVFGISSSPFLLNATIKHHLGLQKFQTESLQNTVEKLKEGFYVDNLVTSVNDAEELKTLKSQAIEVLKEGRFELRCWASNAYEEDKEEQESVQMVLGLKWNVISDELSCKLPENLDFMGNKSMPITKRVLLSVINSIYDPIGFTTPALLLPKLLLQEAWREKVDWDQVLPSELEQKFRRWEKTTDLIPECKISRRMCPKDVDGLTLHIFSDASSYAYAACIFLRCEYQGQVTVKLIAAKSRVAPLQRPTIPRLELLGAAIGARLAATLDSSLPPISGTYYWTDSMVVLSWITKMEPWNTFVGNRVKEIRELTKVEDWRHVRGEVNPADLATRSCDWSDLLKSQWWEGPTWLYQNEEYWPTSEITIPEEALLERRKTVVTNLAADNEEKFGNRFLYFSSYTRTLRMTAYVLRFCNNIRKNSQKLFNEITFEEIEKAESTLIKIIQSEWPTEISEKYKNTTRFYKEDGILKVETKLILSQDPESFTRPTVLPEHPIVEKLISHTHRSLMHAGVLTTLAHLRERFWIPKGRKVVAKVLRKCIPCKKLTSKNVNPDPAPLPPNRIERVSAFQITGIDLAGPLYLRGGSKAWIVLFTCAVYRAVHLELVSSLSTEAFMQALRRFWARRGRCSTIYTDNGTNFTGASNALKSLDWDLIQTECAVKKIKWIFSPPCAPWYGGFWERMIRSVKELLRKGLGKACVTYEEMLTLLSDCEATINGRPLTYLSDDPNELKPLTPAHFIQDIREQETTDLDIIDSQHMLKRIRYLQTLRTSLRKRFYKEYLGELIKNPKTNSKRKVIAPGDIVIVESKTPNKLNWPLAKVLDLFPGKDNVERVAKLRVANGEIIRPVQRIYPLELSSEDKLGEETAGTKPTLEAEPCETEDSGEVKTTRFGRRIVSVKRMNL